MDDSISRQTVLTMLDDIEDEVMDGEGYQYGKWSEYVEQLPSTQPQRMRGRWIESNLVPSRKGKPDGRLFICSECNKGWVKQDRSMKGINFCPNCGSYNGGEE